MNIEPQFYYGVCRGNNHYFSKESTETGDNNYSPNKKYAIFLYRVNSDHSESTISIKYMNNMKVVKAYIERFYSWFNYPTGYYKSKGTIKNQFSHLKQIKIN